MPIALSFNLATSSSMLSGAFSTPKVKSFSTMYFADKEVSNEINSKHVLQEPIEVEVMTAGIVKM